MLGKRRGSTGVYLLVVEGRLARVEPLDIIHDHLLLVWTERKPAIDHLLLRSNRYQDSEHLLQLIQVEHNFVRWPTFILQIKLHNVRLAFDIVKKLVVALD